MTKQVDHNDYWYIKDNPLSKVGVFPYLGRTISEDLEPDKIYQVLRPEEELNDEETLNSFKLIPIVDDHTMLGTREGMQPAEEKGVHGVIGDDVYFKDGTIFGDLKIFSETLKEEIENGKKELSMGYFCDYELTEGEYEGQPYQAIQRNLRINHVALVDEGRMGADVRVLDHKFTCDTIKEINQMTLKTNTKSLQKSALDEDIEEITKTEEDCNGKDSAGDEIIEILKAAGVGEEVINAVAGKLGGSEVGSTDEDDTDKDDDKPAQDEDPSEEKKEDETSAEDDITEPIASTETQDPESGAEVKVEVSMDAMIKEIGQRDALIDAVKPLIGDNIKFKQMTSREVAKYACDKLDLKVSNGQEVSVLRGYLAATKRNENKITYSLDNAPALSSDKDDAFERYLKGE